MARQIRQAQAEIVPITTRSESPRRCPKGKSPPKSEARDTIGKCLAHWTDTTNLALNWSAKTIITLYGSVAPRSLAARHIPPLNRAVAQSPSANTRQVRATSLRRCLFYLSDNYRANPALAEQIARTPRPRPRNVTATNQEREALIAAAPDHVKVWLLLCSDLGIRSGTAALITPNHYDSERRELTFSTKLEEKLTLPATQALHQLLATPGLDRERPYVSQLSTAPWARGAYRRLPMTASALRLAFKRLCREQGITRRIVPHDLRRTTAVRVYEQTQDLRLVQALLGHSNLTSTLWYLDHHTTNLTAANLELASLNPQTERIQ